ncbi:MAG: methyl-accepting chemotaxis protein [Ignavibacteriaceae bacterium]|nr:methyl-accepting chemotaxis protein [Ignavibacteriaceae bacterium]
MIKVKTKSFRMKTQLAFFIIAAISTMIAANDVYQFLRLSSINEVLTRKIIVADDHLNNINSEFKNLHYELLKFSIPGFENRFDEIFTQVDKTKKKIIASLGQIKDSSLQEIMKEHPKNFDQIFNEYFGLVVDGTLSAAAMKDYEMASEIATTIGEETRKKFDNELKAITGDTNDKKMMLEAEVSKIISDSIITIIVGMVLGTIAFLITFLKIIPKLLLPIGKFKELLNKFSLGDFREQSTVNTKDEFGEMSIMLNKLRDSQLEKIDAAEKIASGNLNVQINALSQYDSLSSSFNVMIENLNKLVKEMNRLTDESVKGISTTRGNEKAFDGAYKQIIQGMNNTLDAIYAPINEAVIALEQIASGDLTTKIDTKYHGDHEKIKNSINHATDSLGKTISEVSSAVYSAAESAKQISKRTEQMALGAQEQSAQASQVVHAVDEMTKSILDSTTNTSIAADASKLAGKVAKDGGKVVEETIHGMIRIADVVKTSADTVKALGKSSEQIGEIVQVIDDIADQTNLLALNAAIEAARAGEQGRGFAVVADEVRKLAERTTKATKEIASMIKQIQKDTFDAVDSMQKGTEEVEKGKLSAQKAGESLREIIGGADKVVDIVSQVAAASEEQSATAEQISKSIESITNVTQESASGIQQIANAAEDLNKLTYNLQELVSQFKINESHGNLSVRQNGKLIKSNVKHSDNPASLIDV